VGGLARSLKRSVYRAGLAKKYKGGTVGKLKKKLGIGQQAMMTATRKMEKAIKEGEAANVSTED
jgi:hypothetical protein